MDRGASRVGCALLIRKIRVDRLGTDLALRLQQTRVTNRLIQQALYFLVLATQHAFDKNWWTGEIDWSTRGPASGEILAALRRSGLFILQFLAPRRCSLQ